MYAPYHNGDLKGNPPILGAFNEKGTGNRFEFTTRSDEEMDTFAPDYPHKIFVGPWGFVETRAALVLKTVAYVVIDEGAEGNPVVEKWLIKNWVEYSVVDKQ